MKLRIVLLPDRVGICRLPPASAVPAWSMAGSFWSVTRTADELSVICAEDAIPAGETHEGGWRCLKVEGPLAFDVIGVVSSLTAPLAAAGVSVFVTSTYDTDYLLVKADRLEAAVSALTAAGHEVKTETQKERPKERPN
jgi:hypothetical protein